MIVTGPGIAPSTWIVAQLDSGVAGIGTYTVSVSQNVAKTKIIGQFYFMNSVYALVLQFYVIWWYWPHLMKFNASVLKLLRVDFEFFMGFRPVTIIFSVILFNVNFVFVRGLRHFVDIFHMVIVLTKMQMHVLKDAAASLELQLFPTTIILSYDYNTRNPFTRAGSQFFPSLDPSNHQESANCRREKYVVDKLDRQIHPLGRIFAYRFCFLREFWLEDEWFQSMIVLFEICLISALVCDTPSHLSESVCNLDHHARDHGFHDSFSNKLDVNFEPADAARFERCVFQKIVGQIGR